MSRPTCTPAAGRLTGLAVLVALTAAPAWGAGFGIFEQGTKAMGMAGAFTAQADDGSAMFHNIAGIGFIEEKTLQAGVTLISPASVEFTGADPFPGSDARGEGVDAVFTPPHVYYVRPLDERVVFGFAINSPFGLSTEWEDRETWVGRFISARAVLETFDFNPGAAIKLGDDFSVGLGAIVRLANVELFRHVPVFDPFTFTVRDAATVTLESDFQHGWGYNVGILHRPSERFSWGISYRSEVEIEFSGDGRFEQISTGNPVLDAVVASRIPFDRDLPVRTAVEFPAMASFGVAFGLGERFLVEVDANWTDWSAFEEINISFPENPQFSSVIPENYSDAWNYRLGLAFDLGENQLRLGYVFDESPQPDESVGPLLPDADRDGFTIGFGFRDRLDLALMYLPFEERTTTTNFDNFNGTWETTAWLLGATYTF